MADTEKLNQDVQNLKEDSAHSFGQLKNDAVRVAQSAAEAARSGVESVKSKLTEGTETAKARYAEGTETLKAKYADGTEVLKAKYADGSEKVRQAADQARERGNDMVSELQTKIEENPLQAVAIAAGVGVLLGVLMRRN